ncbi:hypothetical protein [Phormidium sp. CCY1219]|nr:hypothetical protein [Phormidium sp. CCY1219]
MMQVSQRALVIIAEATATSAIGLVHAGAGVGPVRHPPHKRG